MTHSLVRVAVVFLVVAVAVSHGVALSGADHNPVQHLEIVPGSHQPGAEETDTSVFAWRFRTPSGPVDAEVWGNVTLIGPSGGAENCVINRDARAAGVDRDNDDPGTTTDDSLLGRFKLISHFENDAGQPGITVQMYQPEDFGGESIHLNHSDEAVARVANCIDNPDEPGWYRWFGYTNGTGYDGEYLEGATYSHWYYLCDCDSYDEAVGTIGPAPPTGEEDQRTDYLPHDGEPGRPQGPFNLSVPRTNWDGSGGADPPAASPTATATATPDGSDPGTATGGTTPAGTSDPAATAGPTPTADGGAGPTATATATDGNMGVTEVTSPESTNGGGPGFGPVAALVALLAAALLARRY